MRNNLIFNGRKESIREVINKAIIDHQQWTEAITQPDVVHDHSANSNVCFPNSEEEVIRLAKLNGVAL